MTGAEIKRHFLREIDKTYTDFYNDVKINDLLFQAMIEVIESKYEEYQKTQKITDEIRALIEMGYNASVTSNVVDLSAIPAYMHLLGIECTFKHKLKKKISKYTNYLNYVNITIYNHNFHVGDTIYVYNNNIGGAEFVDIIKIVDCHTIQTNLPPQNDTTISNTDIHISSRKRVLEIKTDRQGFTYSTPTSTYPRYKIGADGIIISGVTAELVYVDYLKAPTVVIDVADDTDDLTLTYPAKLILNIIHRAAKKFGMDVKDIELINNKTEEIITNP